MKPLNCVSIGVIGDVMLDCYLHGEVNRISPEAPVPVVATKNERYVPGGAANVACNLLSLGIKTHLVGLTGDDEARRNLLSYLNISEKIFSSELIIQSGRCTTKKLRIIGEKQQIARIDFEDNSKINYNTENYLISAAKNTLNKCNLIVLSDYGKGVLSDRVLSETIEVASSLKRHIILDPKIMDWRVYRGVTLITPNKRELSSATGLPCETDSEIVTAARIASGITDADILVTRAEKGMSFVPKVGDPIHIGTTAKNVFDVSGAGDTVVAVLAATLAAGYSMHEAMRMANHAAGIVIGKIGTATVTIDELEDVVISNLTNFNDGSLVLTEEIVSLRKHWRNKGFTVGFANGVFDLLHPGHISLLKQASLACDRLIVALNSDASTKRLKGPKRPFQNESSRATVIGAIKGVAAVVIFQEDTPINIIRMLIPDLIVKGSDYDEDDVVGADFVKANGGRVLLVDLKLGQSTTSISKQFTVDNTTYDGDKK